MSTQINHLQVRSMQCVDYDAETYEWIFDFGEAHVLQVASPWRLLREGRIALGHCDHNQCFRRSVTIDARLDVLEAVRDQPVVVATIADATADLSIELANRVCLEVFNNSSNYEGWTFNAPGGRLLVAQGGGNVVTWTGSA